MKEELKDKKHIIVTGGAGFIGINTVKALRENGFSNITIVDTVSEEEKEKRLEGILCERYFDRDDFLVAIKEDSIESPGAIIHLGACSDTTEGDKEYIMRNNTEYSKELFKYCERNKVPFIYASSAATYGDGSNGYSDDERNLKPLNYYGISKYLFDEWALQQKEVPPQWVGLKFFNVYGPHEEHKGRMASVARHGFYQVTEDKEIRLFKSYKQGFVDGGQKRDFVYVKDVVDVILFFLDHPDKNGIFNVGTGRSETFMDVAQAVFAVLGEKENIKFIDMPEDLKGKYQYFTQADISKLRATGYEKPFMTVMEGVEDYVKDYLLIRYKK